MITPLRNSAGRIVILKEKIENIIARRKGIFTLNVPILMYHHINSEISYGENPKLYVDQELFEKEMKYLKHNKYKTITLDDLLEHLKKEKNIPYKGVILTFDDGNLDFYIKAFPILELFKLKATVFVITNMINKPNYLTTAMLQKMHKSSLITIGSHTVNHPDLTTLPVQKVFYELNESKKILKNMTGININSFAFPYGRYNEEVLEGIKKAGYLNAVTTKYGKLHKKNTLYELKRIRLGNKLTLNDFIRRIN